jgi:hypothetical protein
MSTEKAASERRQRPTPRGFKRPQDFARKNGMGINQVYQAVKDGSLPSVRVGGSIFIPDDAFERALAKKTQGAK